MQTKKLVCASALALALGTSGIAMAQYAGTSEANPSATQKTQKSKVERAKPENDTTGANSAKVGKMDQTFLMKAAQGGIAEVELGQLAQAKASNDKVKEFAKRMVDDHTKANDQLKSLAQSENVPVPTEPAAKDKALKNRLAKLSGPAFDKMYMSHMVQDHVQDVSEFQKESSAAKDDNVKQFASQTLPTLQDHLKQAKEINQSLTGKSAKSE